MIFYTISINQKVYDMLLKLKIQCEKERERFVSYSEVLYEALKEYVKNKGVTNE